MDVHEATHTIYSHVPDSGEVEIAVLISESGFITDAEVETADGWPGDHPGVLLFQQAMAHMLKRGTLLRRHDPNGVDIWLRRNPNAD